MATIKNIDLSNLGEYFNDNGKKVNLTKDNDLYFISKYFTEKCILHFENNPEAEVTPENIVKVISDLDAEIENVTMQHYATMEKLSGIMARGFNEGLITIKNNVAKDVSKLTEEIHKKVNAKLIQLGADEIIEDDEENVDSEKVEGSDFTEINFDEFEDFTDTDTFLTCVGMSTNIDKDRLATYNFADYQRMHSAFKGLAKNITISPEARLEMIKRITKLTGITGEHLEKTIDTFFSSQKDWANIKSRFQYEFSNPSETYLNYKKIIGNYYKLANELKDMDFDLPEETLSVLKSNVLNIIHTCEAMRFGMLCMKKQYQDRLILTDKIINKDVLPKFLEGGGTKQDIKRHIFVHHIKPEYKVPISGITDKLVLETKENTNKKYEAHKEDIRSKKQEYKNIATTSAYKDAILEYLQRTESNKISSNIGDKNLFIKNGLVIRDNFIGDINDSKISMEDALYRFLIKLWYKDSIVEDIYQTYYSNTVAAAENLDDTGKVDTAVIEAKVCTNVFVKFLMKNFTE